MQLRSAEINSTYTPMSQLRGSTHINCCDKLGDAYRIPSDRPNVMQGGPKK